MLQLYVLGFAATLTYSLTLDTCAFLPTFFCFSRQLTLGSYITLGSATLCLHSKINPTGCHTTVHRDCSPIRLKCKLFMESR